MPRPVPNPAARLPGGPGRGAVLAASPLEVGTYLLRLPAGKQERKASIRNQLKTQYPGNLSGTRIDIKILAREKDEAGRPLVRAAVFAAAQETAAVYLRTKVPPIPGIAVLKTALGFLPRKKGTHPPALAVLITGEYLEAAFFKDGIPENIIAIGRRPASDPLRLIRDLIPEEVSGGAARDGGAEDGGKIMTVLIRDGIEEQDRYLRELTETFGPRLVLEMKDVLTRINAGKERIFRRDCLEQGGKAAAVAAAAPLALIPLLLFLHDRILRMEGVVSGLRQRRSEQMLLVDREANLRKEMEQYETTPPEQEAAGGMNVSVYEIIAELHKRMPGCGIRSLTIRENTFSLEAEGRDSLAALGALRDSGLFTGIVLHQTTPRQEGGESFSLSGGITRGK